ncbi:MAG: protein kinase, partial [Chloroflexi bacterium]|nr:protein kinase [Chloroflexota bacterium]
EGEGEAASTSTGPSRASGHGPAASARAGLPLDRTIEIGKAVCEGLEFAHARGIVHRDLKPGNVWLTEDGTAKIGDFGLAVMTDRSRLTREGMMVGTVSYMPPEQATGGEITPKADLYSLGAMLYEMVTGRPPLVRATLGLRLLLEIGLIGGIVVAAILHYDGATVWIAAVVGIALAVGMWGVFAVPGDPSRSGKTVIATPAAVRPIIEIGLFATVTAWLVVGEGYALAALLGGGAVIHYA